MASTTTTTYELLPKQDAAVFAKERHVAYSGAVGAGKSYCACISALIHCAGRPNARCGLFRKTLVGLKKSTLKTLIEGDGDVPPVLPRGSYTHNKVNCEIKIKGGGTILYSGIETPESILSMNLSKALIDEVIELTAEDYSAVDTRVRTIVDNEPLQILSFTNPGQPSHWYAKMMGLSPEKPYPDPDCRVILTRTEDNTHLSDSYIKSFERHKGSVYYRRMFLGEWCGSDGMVYDRFSRDEHVIDRTAYRKSSAIGVDDGYTDPFVVLDIAIDSDGRKHIARETYESKLVMSEKIARVKSMWDGEGPVVVDSAAPDLIESLRRAGVGTAVACGKGPGSINYGINLVQTELATESDGVPMLTVNPNCTNTIREFESYEWKPGIGGVKDQPRDMNNHAMDSVRYCLRYICEERGGRVLSSYSDEPDGGVARSKTYSEMRAEDPEFGWQ